MITHVQQFGTNVSGGLGSATTGNATVTKGNTIICGIFGYSDGGLGIATPSDTLGNSWSTAIGPFRMTVGGSQCVMYVFYIKALNGSGTDAVKITWTGQSPSTSRVHCHEVSGLAANPLDQTNTNAATSASMTSGNVTTTLASEFLYGYGVDNSGNPTVGSGWTQGITEGSEYDEWRITSSVGTYAATYTGDGGAYGDVIATFKGAPGGAQRALVGAGT
jgi:hypothetical protein